MPPRNKVGEAHFELKVDSKAFRRGFDRAEGVARTRFSSMKKMAIGAGAAMAVAIGGVAVIGAVDKAVSKFNEVKLAGAQLRTMLRGIGDEDFKKITSGLMQLSNEIGTTFFQLEQGAYSAASAGIHADKIVSFMETAGRAAIAGATDVDVMTQALIRFSNVYTDRSVDEHADLIFKTIELGNLRAEELARFVPSMLNIAKMADNSIEDTLTLVAHGSAVLETSRLADRSRQMWIEMGKDNSGIGKAILAAHGQSFASLKQGGMADWDIMAPIFESKGMTEFGKLWTSTEAKEVAALNVGDDNLKRLREIRRGYEETTGSMGKAFDIIYAEQAYERAQNRMNNEWIKAGEIILPHLVSVLEGGVLPAMAFFIRLLRIASPVVSWMFQLIHNMGRAIRTLYQGMMNLGRNIENILRQWLGIGTDIPFLEGLFEKITGINWDEKVRPFLEGIEKFFQDIDSGITTWFNWLKDNPLFVLGGLAAVIAALLLGGPMAAFAVAMAVFGGSLFLILTEQMDIILDQIETWVKDHFPLLFTFLQSLNEELSSFIDWLLRDNSKDNNNYFDLSDMDPKFLGPPGFEKTAAAWSALTEKWTEVLGVVFAGLGDWLKENFPAVFQGVDLAAALVESIASLVSNIGDTLHEKFIETTGLRLKDAKSWFWSTLSGIFDWANAFVSFSPSTVNTIGAMFSSMGDQLLTSFKSGVSKGMDAIRAWFWSMIADVFTFAVGGIPHQSTGIVGNTSPLNISKSESLEVMKQRQDRAEHLWTGAEIVRSNATLQSAYNRLPDALQIITLHALAEWKTKAEPHFVAAKAWLLEKIVGMWEWVGTQLSNVWQRIAGVVVGTGIADPFTGETYDVTLGERLQGFVEAANGFIGPIKDAATGVFEAMRGLGSGVEIDTIWAAAVSTGATALSSFVKALKSLGEWTQSNAYLAIFLGLAAGSLLIRPASLLGLIGIRGKGVGSKFGPGGFVFLNNLKMGLVGLSAALVIMQGDLRALRGATLDEDGGNTWFTLIITFLEALSEVVESAALIAFEALGKTVVAFMVAIGAVAAGPFEKNMDLLIEWLDDIILMNQKLQDEGIPNVFELMMGERFTGQKLDSSTIDNWAVSISTLVVTMKLAAPLLLIFAKALLLAAAAYAVVQALFAVTAKSEEPMDRLQSTLEGFQSGLSSDYAPDAIKKIDPIWLLTESIQGSLDVLRLLVQTDWVQIWRDGLVTLDNFTKDAMDLVNNFGDGLIVTFDDIWNNIMDGLHYVGWGLVNSLKHTINRFIQTVEDFVNALTEIVVPGIGTIFSGPKVNLSGLMLSRSDYVARDRSSSQAAIDAQKRIGIRAVLADERHRLGAYGADHPSANFSAPQPVIQSYPVMVPESDFLRMSEKARQDFLRRGGKLEYVNSGTVR